MKSTFSSAVKMVNIVAMLIAGCGGFGCILAGQLLLKTRLVVFGNYQIRVKSKMAVVYRNAICTLKSMDLWTDSGLGRFELGYIRDKQQHEVDFVVVRDGEPWMLVEVKSSLDEPLSPSLKAFAAKLKVAYAFQVAVEAEPSSVNPLDYEREVVKISFADLAKVLV